MITTKQELRFYLDADRFSLMKTKKRPGVNDEIWRYQIYLRKVEYLNNVTGGVLNRIMLRYYQLRKHKLGIALGFDIPHNVFGPGLRINHHGYLVVSPSARVGGWCDIHQGVNIGTNNSPDGRALAPKIGANVWIGPGAKLFGDITIGDEAQIGANAVVNRDVPTRSTVGGVPARVISSVGTNGVNVAASRPNMQMFVSQHPQYRRYFVDD